MRIISKFNDYYDNAMALGQDQSVVYQRTTLEYNNLRTATSVVKELHNMVIAHTQEKEPWRYYRSHVRGLPNVLYGKSDTFDVSSGVVVFCGKMYRYVELERRPTAQTLASTHCFYSVESMVEFCEQNKIPLDVASGKWNKTTTRESIEKVFSKKNTISESWLIENKVICAVVTKSQVVVNPCLKEVQFFKVFDSYTAFQELDMWVSGTLAFPQNEMVMLDDKSMIAKHGFDKWSFRKQPKGYKG